MSNIAIIGVDHNGLAVNGREILGQCSAVFTTARFHDLLLNFKGAIHPITPLASVMNQIEAAGNDKIAILASGDPLFFGIAKSIIQRFGRASVEVYPALSSMQLAFAHLKEPWSDSVFISLHGRSSQDIAALILPHRKVFLFTDKVNNPAQIAAQLLSAFQSPESCRIFVAENLGLPDERLTHGSPTEIATQKFSDLNVMIIQHDASTQINSPLGLTEEEISHSRGLITKNEVRAAVLHKLRLPAHGVLWDIGAGSGSISLEAGRLCPGLEVWTVEHKREGQENITTNIKRFGLNNMHLVEGRAPEVLLDLPEPDRIFIGGSSGALSEIIKFGSEQLSPTGIVVVTAVTESTRVEAPRLLHNQGFKVKISEITVSRNTYPPSAAGITFNPITIITGSR